MPFVAVTGSTTQGTTTGEHHGHTDSDGNPLHSAGTLTGVIGDSGSKLKVKGQSVAVPNTSIAESDNCGSGTGHTNAVSHKLKVKGQPVQCIGDSVSPHNGSASIVTGNSKLLIN